MSEFKSRNEYERWKAERTGYAPPDEGSATMPYTPPRAPRGPSRAAAPASPRKPAHETQTTRNTLVQAAWLVGSVTGYFVVHSNADRWFGPMLPGHGVDWGLAALMGVGTAVGGLIFGFLAYVVAEATK